MTTVLMVGGGIQQVKAVAAARALGMKVAVSDRNPAAAAMALADFAVPVDGRDVEGLIAFVLARKADLRIAGIFTLTELVTTVACVAAATGLPGVPPAAAVACQNKGVGKRIWQEAGVPTPRGGTAETLEEATALLASLGGRAFLKPVVGFGGQGAGHVSSARELAAAFHRSAPSRGAGRVLIEEAVEGSMHDVNGLFDRGGTFHPMGIVDREFLPGLPVETGIRTPTALGAKEQESLYRLLERGARALGAEFGPVKGDAVLSPSGFRLIEAAPRLHGPKCSLYALPFSGFHPLAPTLLTIAGRETGAEVPRVVQDRHVLIRALLPPPGTIRKVEGIEAASSLPGVEEVLLFAGEGRVVPPYRDGTHVPGFIAVSGKTPQECDRTAEKALSLIHIDTGADE